RQPPDPGAQRFLDEFFNIDSNSALSDKFKKLLKNLGMVIAPIITAIATMLGTTFHFTGR
ncbi:unnamed protein product, partial [marine sediment metagenome]